MNRILSAQPDTHAVDSSRLQCRLIYFPRTPDTPKQQQSHIMDLLDISLGATSISGAPPTDPWGMAPPQAPRPQVHAFYSKNFSANSSDRFQFL